MSLVTAVGLLLGSASCLPDSENTRNKDKAPPATQVDSSLTDASVDTGVRLPPGPSWGSLLVDYDLNGWPDLLINRHKRHPRLYRNNAGMFKIEGEPVLDTTAPGRQIYDRHGCAWGEANGDGRPDLYCASGAQDGQGEGPNQLLLQTNSGFTYEAAEWNAQDKLGRGRSVHWLDYDSDGDLDIFVSNEVRAGHPNIMLRNDGDSFSSVDIGLSEEIATRSSSWSDWDNDGDPDILVLGHGFVGSRAFRNNDGTYEEVPFPAVTGEEWLSASWGDFDLNGWNDVALVSETRLMILRNRSASFSRMASFKLKAGRVAAWLDIENDGDLDAYVVQGQVGDPPKPGAINHVDFLLINDEGKFRPDRRTEFRGPTKGNGDSVAVSDINRDGSVDVHVTEGYLDLFGSSRLLLNRFKAANWIGVRLRGPDQNPLAIGARVTARTSDRRYQLSLTDGVAFKSQSEIGYAHFGIGEAEVADVRVEWPDGSVSCESVAADGVVTLSFDSSGCS